LRRGIVDLLEPEQGAGVGAEVGLVGLAGARLLVDELIADDPQPLRRRLEPDGVPRRLGPTEDEAGERAAVILGNGRGPVLLLIEDRGGGAVAGDKDQSEVVAREPVGDAGAAAEADVAGELGQSWSRRRGRAPGQWGLRPRQVDPQGAGAL